MWEQRTKYTSGQGIDEADFHTKHYSLQGLRKNQKDPGLSFCEMDNERHCFLFNKSSPIDALYLSSDMKEFWQITHKVTNVK